MIKCISHKKVYLTEAIAEDALIEARTQYNYPAGSGPIAVYRCDDCGNYHLTSQGTINQKLSLYMSQGKINREKEANAWLKKIKRK